MTDMTFDVSGMTCGNCTARVQRALQQVPGVRSSSVTLNPGRAVVQVDDGVPAGRIEQAIAAAGYAARRADVGA